MAGTRRTRVPTVAKLAPPVVVAGMVLGWLLGSAANPVMKYRAEPGPDTVLQAASALAGPSDESWPALVPSTSNASDSYRPDFDYNAVVGAEWAFPDASAEADLAPPPSLAAAFKAAGNAEQAAEDAAAAMTAPGTAPRPDEPATEPEARKSALARSGLY